MLYLYLDESGDLGFNLFAKKPSKYFAVTVMLMQCSCAHSAAKTERNTGGHY